MKKRLAALFLTIIMPVAFYLALPVGTAGCKTSSGSNTSALANPIIGANGLLTTAIDSGISLGAAFGISQCLAHSPQHAAQIKADLAIVLAALQALQGNAATVTPAQVTTALTSLKLSSTEVQLLIPQFTTLLNDALSTLSAQGVNNVAYVPKLLNALATGIQSGLGISAAIPSAG